MNFFLASASASSFDFVNLIRDNDKNLITEKYYIFNNSNDETKHHHVLNASPSVFSYINGDDKFDDKFSNDIFWGKLLLKNSTEKEMEYDLRHMGIVHTFEVALYSSNGRLLSTGKYGAGTFKKNEKYSEKIKIKIPSHQTVIIVFKYTSSSHASMSFSLNKHKINQSIIINRMVMWGLTYGLFVALLMSNLFMYFVSLDKIHLSYNVFLLCISYSLLQGFSPFGVAQFKVVPDMSEHLISFLSFSGLFCFYFILNIIGRKSLNTKFKKMFFVHLIMTFFFGVFCLFVKENFTYLFNIHLGFNYIGTLLCLGIIIHRYFILKVEKVKYLIYGTIPMLFFFTFIKIVYLLKLDFNPSGLGNMQVLCFGFFSFCASMAIAHRTDILRKSLLSSHAKREENLQSLVKSKTMEILDTKKRLQVNRSFVLLGGIVRSVLLEITPAFDKLVLIKNEVKSKIIDENLEDKSKVKVSLDRIHKGLDRIHELKKSFLFLASSENDKQNFRAKFSMVNLNAALQECDSVVCLNILSEESISKIKYPIDLDLQLEGIESQVYAVFNHIIMNALESMQRNGIKNEEQMITISTPLISFEDNIVEIFFIDSGPGILASDVSYVCEPFNTGNQAEGHLGLGLFDVKNIMELHRGDIRFIEGPVKGHFYPLLRFLLVDS